MVTHSQLHDRLGKYSIYFEAIFIFTTALVLFGWQFIIEFLKQPVPNLGAMNPVTAVGFMAAAFSFLLLASPRPSPRKLATGKLLAIVVIGLAAKPTNGAMKYLMGNLAGNIKMRQLIPAALLISVVMAFIYDRGQTAGYHNVEFDVALIVSGIVLLLIFFIVHNAILMNKAEALKIKDEKKLHKVNEHLDEQAMQQLLYASIVSSSDDAIISKTLEGVITSWNHGAEKIFGYTETEAIGRNISFIIPAELLEEELSIVSRIKRGERLVQYETKRVKKDGSHTHVSLTISPVLDADGNIVGASKIARDITERKAAEKLILRSNRFYLFISQINQMIVRTTDKETVFKEACKIAVDIGKFKMAWIGLIDEEKKKIIPVMHAGGDDANPFIRTLFTIHNEAGGKALQEETYIVCNDLEKEPEMAPWKSEVNKYGYHSSMSLPIKKFGKVVGFFSFYASVKNFFDSKEIALLEEATGDVSFALENFEKEEQRKRAEESVRLNEQKLELIFNTTTDVIYLLSVQDGRYCFTSVNKSFFNTTGLTEEQVLGKFVEEVIPEPSLSMVLQNYQAAINSKQTLTWEETSEYPVGTKTGIVSITPIFDDMGKCSMLVGSVHDITERKKTETRLVESENFLRTILDTEPECVKVLNSKGELLFMNPSGLVMLEAYNEQQVLGHRMTEFVDAKYRMGFSQLSKEVFKGNTGTFEFEITGLKGGHRWLETHAVPLKDETGKITNLLGVTRDITEHKKNEEEVKDATTQLRQLAAHLQTMREEERKRIGREIHDELGQLLTAIKMDLSWIENKIPEETTALKLKNSIGLLDETNKSIRRILAELRPSMLDNVGLVEALNWQSQQFTLTTGIPVDFWHSGDIGQLPEDISICIVRIYQESLTNVMRHASANLVASSLTVTANKAVFVIEDDGKGFDYASGQNKNSFGILGMKERMLSLGGIFDLVSMPGKGTKITISLPYTIKNGN